METKIIRGVPTTKDDAISSNIGLVKKVASKYEFKAKRVGLDFEDLMSIGVIGLITAFDKFDDSRGNQFSTVATWNILGEISRAIQNGYDKAVRYPVHIKEVASKIGRKQLENESIENIASKLGVKRDYVVTALEYMKSDMPLRLDLPAKLGNHDEGSLLHDILGEEQDFSVAVVDDFLSCLNNRERDVVIYSMEGDSHRDIARKWGTSKSLVWQYHQQIKWKLQDYLEGNYLPVYVK